MTRRVRKVKPSSGRSRVAWPALVLAVCLVAEAAGFVVVHQSTRAYQPAAPASGHAALR